MKVKKLKRLILISAVFCMMFGTALGETAPAETETAVSTAVEETVSSETVESSAETAASEAEATSDPDIVEDPNFANTQDPLATLRTILAAIGAFAIAFMYSRMQHSKSRARNKK